MSKQIHTYYSLCIDCGRQKHRTISERCKNCASTLSANAIRKNVYYENCSTCGERKPRTRRPNCKRCGGINAAIRKGHTGHTYDVCGECLGPKPRNSNQRCRRCAAIAGAIGRNTGEWRHNAEKYVLNPIEAAERQREAHQCARMLRARIAARFRPGVPMNRASLREMFAPDRDEREAA